MESWKNILQMKKTKMHNQLLIQYEYLYHLLSTLV
jgi:hypothetical protein